MKAYAITTTKQTPETSNIRAMFFERESASKWFRSHKRETTSSLGLYEFDGTTWVLVDVRSGLY